MAQYRLKHLEDAAKDMRNQGSALVAPLDSEAQSLNEKQAQINAVKQADAPAAPPDTVAGPPINREAKYGDRPGEKRIDVGGMTTPLGSARAGGGPVKAGEPYTVGEEGPEVIVPEEDGEVIPNEGAPADFGGPVFANPNHVKPKLDTESPDIPKASVGMDVSNPAPAQIIPGQKQEGVKGKLSSTTLSSAPSGAPVSATGAPSMKPLGGAHEAVAQEKAAQDVDVAKQRDLIEQDKKVAAAKGGAGLMDLGIASIHEDVLNKTHPPEGAQLEGEQAVPPAPDAEGLPVTTNTDQGLGKMTPTPPPHAALEQKREELKRIIEGPDTEAAGVAMRQLAELNKNNPWGTEANHPGFLGKIAHGLAKAGNIAGNIAAPGTMALIPGTDLNMNSQALRGQAEEARGAEVKKDDALAKAANVKGTVPKYEIKEVMDNRPGSPTQGKTVWAGVNPANPADVQYSPGEVAAKTGAGSNAPANPTQVSEYNSQVPALTPHLSPEERKAYEFPVGYTPTIAEIATNKKDAAAADAVVLSGNREDRAQKAADAAAKKLTMEERLVEDTAKSIASMDIHDLSPIKNLASLRGDQRLQIYARAKEINPNFNTGEIDRKIKMMDNYTNGKEGQNLQSFGTFFEHAAQLSEVINDLRNTGFKDFNHPWNWFRDHIGDPRIANFLAAAEPVKKEFESFLLNNRALYESDRKEMNEVLGGNMAPDALQTVIGTMGHTAAARYNESDHRFKNLMGVNITEGIGPMAPEAIDAAKKIGVDLSKHGSGGEEKAGGKEKETSQPSPEEQQKILQGITLPDGTHPAAMHRVKRGTLIWSGKAGDPWLDLATQKPVGE